MFKSIKQHGTIASQQVKATLAVAAVGIKVKFANKIKCMLLNYMPISANIQWFLNVDLI